MIDVAHRLMPKKGQPNRSIIVLFHNRTDRENFYHQKGKLKHLHINQLIPENEEFPTDCKPNVKRDSNTFIYMNESHTPENKELLSATRKRAKEFKYMFVWTHKDRYEQGIRNIPRSRNKTHGRVK